MRERGLDAGEPPVEAHDEIAAPDLAPTDDVDPRPFLVGDG